MAGLALSALTYLAWVAVETGEHGYSQECLSAHGWAIREMIAAIREAISGDEPRDEMCHVHGTDGPPMVGQSIEDAVMWLRIVTKKTAGKVIHALREMTARDTHAGDRRAAR